MEAFRVTCETCRSRLKIRSPEVIGEIHACPKCGSMVQIVPPAGWTADAAKPPLTVAQVAAAAGPALTLSTSSSTILPADFAVDLPAAPVANDVPAHVVIEPNVLVPAASASGISPVVWWAVGSAALLVAVGLTYALWPAGAQQVAQPAPAVAAHAATDQKSEGAPDKSDVESAAPNADRPATKLDPYAVDHSQDSSVATTVATQVEPATAPSVTAAQSDEPKVTKTSSSTLSQAPGAPTARGEAASAAGPIAASTSPKPSERPDAAPSGASASGSGHVLKFDPLDFDPEHLSLPSNPAAAAAKSPATPSTSSIPTEAPSDAAPGEAASAAGKSQSDQPPATTDLLPPLAGNPPINVRRGPAANDPSRPLDAAQRLAVHIKALQLAEMPLARFAETLSDLAGVPITLDPVTLELNGISPRAAVSVDATDATLDKILRDAFAGQRLDLVEQDGQAGIAIPNGNERRAVDFDVKDLVKDSDAGPIGKLIERFVAPASWQAGGGKGTIEVRGTTLHIDQTLVVRREALIFCERLRIARGLALRSKYPPALLTIDPPYAKLAATLNHPTTFTFLPWTRLADVVRQWQELTGLTILVDWSALREAELDPSSPLACSTIDRPWSDALDTVLEPLKLGWWAVDGQTIQITSLDALKHLERVEFYAIPQKLHDSLGAGDALLNALQKDIDERANKHGEPGDVRISLDDASGRLIVRATPDVQRFLSRRLREAGK